MFLVHDTSALENVTTLETDRIAKRRIERNHSNSVKKEKIALELNSSRERMQYVLKNELRVNPKEVSYTQSQRVFLEIGLLAREVSLSLGGDCRCLALLSLPSVAQY